MAHSTPDKPALTRTALSLLVALFLALSLAASPAAAADDPQPSVVFLGDSVTAGFGFFGQKENAKNITGTVNNPFPSSWNLGDNALSDCSPGDGTPIDQCSNNNYNGSPGMRARGRPDPRRPNVAVLLPDRRQPGPGQCRPGGELGGDRFNSCAVGHRRPVQLPAEHHQEHPRGHDAGREPDPVQHAADQTGPGSGHQRGLRGFHSVARVDRLVGLPGLSTSWTARTSSGRRTSRHRTSRTCTRRC